MKTKVQKYQVESNVPHTTHKVILTSKTADCFFSSCVYERVRKRWPSRGCWLSMNEVLRKREESAAAIFAVFSELFSDIISFLSLFSQVLFSFLLFLLTEMYLLFLLCRALFCFGFSPRLAYSKLTANIKYKGKIARLAAAAAVRCWYWTTLWQWISSPPSPPS